MATFIKLSSGRWRAQVRRRGRSLSQAFESKALAEAWAREQESAIDKGEIPSAAIPKPASPSLASVNPSKAGTLGQLIDLHLGDLLELEHFQADRNRGGFTNRANSDSCVTDFSREAVDGLGVRAELFG